MTLNDLERPSRDTLVSSFTTARCVDANAPLVISGNTNSGFVDLSGVTMMHKFTGRSSDPQTYVTPLLDV